VKGGARPNRRREEEDEKVNREERDGQK